MKAVVLALLGLAALSSAEVYAPPAATVSFAPPPVSFGFAPAGVTVFSPAPGFGRPGISATGPSGGVAFAPAPGTPGSSTFAPASASFIPGLSAALAPPPPRVPASTYGPPGTF